MANGARMYSEGRWKGEIELGGLRQNCEFEVFPSNGAFKVLLGKPFLRDVKAVQDFQDDTVMGQGKDGRLVTVQNQHPGYKGFFGVLDIEECGAESEQEGSTESEQAGGSNQGNGGTGKWGHRKRNKKQGERGKIEYLEQLILGKETDDGEDTLLPSDVGAEKGSEGGDSSEDEGESEGSSLESELSDMLGEELADVQVLDWEAIRSRQKNSARVKDPYSVDRVEKIMQQVSIGSDLLPEQRLRVESLVRAYADIFALSLSEVLPVDFMKHKLNVDPGVNLPVRVHQKPLTDAQKEWWLEILDEMEASGICARVLADYVRCVSSTNLPPKDAGGEGMSRDKIIQK
ncbi:hypothetical protein FS837_005786, partial [Tulasnella sp. UAMH 9824]